MVFIHPPDFGADFNSVGKRAKSAKGIASPMENPNMPMVGPRILPWVDTATSRNPMIGPVHEKLTSTRVNAMRKMDSNPVAFSDFSSILVDHEEGSVNSKAPKKDAAKTMSSRAKKILNHAFVDSAFRALAPKSRVTSSPRNTYITMMLSPYVTASRIAFERSLLRFRKNDTVIGMIGHTQGVSKAKKPPSRPAKKIYQRELS